MIDRILKTEPVRLYSVAVAAVALAAYFVPTDAWPLVLALIAAVLGTGQAVRSQVFSQDTHEAVAYQRQVFSNKPIDDDIPTTGAPEAGAVSWGTLALIAMAVVMVLWAFGEVPR